MGSININGQFSINQRPMNDYIVEEVNNGTSWYRVWASGFKECGFIVSNPASNPTYLINFPFTFTTTNYNAQVNGATIYRHEEEWGGIEKWFYHYGVSEMARTNCKVYAVVPHQGSNIPPFTLYCCGY